MLIACKNVDEEACFWGKVIHLDLWTIYLFFSKIITLTNYLLKIEDLIMLRPRKCSCAPVMVIVMNICSSRMLY